MESFSTYSEMRYRVGEYYGQGSFQEAVEILKWGLKAFPGHLGANVFNLALCQVQLQEIGEAIQTLQFGLERGIWFGPIEIGVGAWDLIREKDEFKAIETRYEELRQEAQETAEALVDIAFPSRILDQKTYPLFIALHGGGETVERFKSEWTSKKLQQEYIVAYPQSSRVISMNGYTWTGEPPDQQEIADAYQEVTNQFPVDKERTLMGGFSAGGNLVFQLLLAEEQIVPCRGFVVLCPPVPREIPVAAVQRMLEREQRGVLITTERDKRLKDQERLAMVFESGGIPLRFEVLLNIGHWYPPDLGNRIDAGIEFVLNP